MSAEKAALQTQIDEELNKTNAARQRQLNEVNAAKSALQGQWEEVVAATRAALENVHKENKTMQGVVDDMTAGNRELQRQVCTQLLI